MMPQADLVERVQNFGRAALESGQVARRLDKLLPLRLRELATARRAGQRAAAAERLALTEPAYAAVVKELVEVRTAGREARVQYETHLMLVEARRSLRAFARRRYFPRLTSV